MSDMWVKHTVDDEFKSKIDISSIAESEDFIEYEIKINNIGSNWPMNNIKHVLNITIFGTKTDNSFSEYNIIVIFSRISSNTENIFKNEQHAYEIIFPALQKLQRKVDMDSDECFRVPTFLKTSRDDEHQYLMIEDIRSSDYRMADFVQSLDFDHLRLVTRKLANLHGTMFALKIFDRDFYDKIVSHSSKYFNNDIKTNIYHQSVDCLNRIKKYSNRLGQIDALDRIINDLSIQQQELTSKSIPEVFDVICHGDCRNGNFLFKYNKDKIPVDVCFLNWQLLRRGSLFIDLHCMLFLSFDTNTRNKYHGEVFDWYYSDLEHVLQSFELDIGNVYPKEKFQADEVRFAGRALALSVRSIYSESECLNAAPKLVSVLSNESIASTDSNNLSDFEKQRVINIVEDFIFYEY